MNRISGRSAFLALLKSEGITHLFGNPGTTELPIMHALNDYPDLTYVMAMQESLVVAMADEASAARPAGSSPATCTSRPGSATQWAPSTMRCSPARR